LLQQRRYQEWLDSVGDLVIIECGAGTSLPTVRRQGDFQWGKLIRINLREPEANKPSAICLQSGALATLQAIDKAIGKPQKHTVAKPC